MNELNRVGDWVEENLLRAEILEDFGIDFCCGGKKTLKEACEEKQLSVQTVMEKLRACGWRRNRASTVELCSEIELVHHDYLKKAIPRIRQHLEKVVHAHGKEYAKLQETFDRFVQEIEGHMKEEETVLFPLIRSGQQIKEEFRHKLEGEHDEAGRLLETLRHLTNHYQTPSHACMTLRLTWKELEELEKDMHLHVYKENHLLFPQVTGS